ncbi:hypothetical protein ASU31_25485 [Pedobacter ginsenosidimutans]|uniref:Uncharacterized protein n=1 Tax=Pedobacter ginsenosidimutans TaxID=687842 RepID=A0A0T5VHE2_9SPHI|nr:hypothetical protein [Pedobacter ginsenosidimutans]KRT13294.1 hypothetical protein ASU31_25485 [Pedobacter ginsenosidimutans]
MNFKILSLSVFSIMSVGFSVKAQDVEENIRMVKPFKADGISNEWNEPLNQYNDATKLAFALANDDKNLYIIIESLDPQTTFSVLRGGITLNINTEGKKKDGMKLTFPLMDRPPMPKEGDEHLEHTPLSPDKDNELHDPAAMNKSIKVSGFKNIADGELPAMNQDGIETGMSIHPNRDLIYELSIPLAQLQVGLDLKKPLVYNIKINEPNKSGFKREGRPEGANGGRGRSGGRGGMGGGGMGGGGRGGMGGGRMGGGGQRQSETGESAAKSSDFWIRYKLVKA